jgi:hypothetical protein
MPSSGEQLNRPENDGGDKVHPLVRTKVGNKLPSIKKLLIFILKNKLTFHADYRTFSFSFHRGMPLTLKGPVTNSLNDSLAKI